MSTFSQLSLDIKEACALLRDSPKGFARIIRKNLPNYKSNNLYHRPGFVPLHTKEGIQGAKSLKKKLRTTESLPKLTESKGLNNAALHIAYLLTQDVPWEDISPTKVINDYGYWTGSVVLLIDEGNVTGNEVVQSLLLDDGLDPKSNQEALLNPYFKYIGTGCVPSKKFVTLNTIILATDFCDNKQMKQVLNSDEKLEMHVELGDWVDNAVKVDCEIIQESSSDRVITRVKQVWQMADDSTLVTEKILD